MLLETYNSDNTKGACSFLVAANDAPANVKLIADYVCDGTADDVQIQAAVDALPSQGGLIHLSTGDFVLAATVSRDIDDVIMQGEGRATYLANDGNITIFDVGYRDGWGFHNLSTDAGGIDLGFNEQADIRNCWINGERKRNRAVDSIEYNNTLASVGYQGSHDVAVQGDYAYVACYQDDAVHIIDISDPESPSITATLTDGSSRLSNAHDIVVDGDYAYVCSNGRNSIVSIDVSAPASPSIADELIDATKLDEVHSLSKQGNYIYAGSYNDNYFCVIDASDPTNMSIIGDVVDATYLPHIRGTYPKGDYVYVVSDTTGYLTVIDVSTKASPVIADSGNAHIQISDSGAHRSIFVKVRDGFAYCAVNEQNKLVVVDVRDVTSLSIAATLTLADKAYYITLAGNYAFIGDYDNDGIWIIDISNPFAPYLIDEIRHDDMEWVSGMAVYKNYLLCSMRDKADKALTILKIPPNKFVLNSKFKRLETTRDMTAATGSVSYTGIGFRPKKITILASNVASAWSDGFCDENLDENVMYTYGDAGRIGWVETDLIIKVWAAAASGQKARVTSLDPDGFTLYWTKNGTPTGTLYLYVLCER